MKPMTEAEWYALGNPPGSFDDLLEMARENTARMTLGPPSKLKPHIWDEWATNPKVEPSKGEVDG